MAYWWQRYSSTPDSNTDTPPDGAPENHFPDQVNNIQRQAMAAVNEIGSLVLGDGDGSPEPQTVPTDINNDFLKIIYDQLLPIGSVRAFDSSQAAVEDQFKYPIPAGPAFASVVWEICDSTGAAGTPNFQDVVLAGANSLVGPSQRFTGDLSAAGKTSLDGEVNTTSLNTGGHVLTEAELAIHPHGAGSTSINGSLKTQSGDDTHNHDIEYTKENITANLGGNNPVVISIDDPGNTTSGDAIQQDGPGQMDIVGFTANAGSNSPHTHPLNTLTIPDHDHDTGQPARAALELYKRVA